MEIGQKVVFVRDVKGAEVGEHGTVTSVAENVVVVDCRLQEHVAPVRAQMWDVLPERVWNRLSTRSPDRRPKRAGSETAILGRPELIVYDSERRSNSCRRRLNTAASSGFSSCK
jgi:hypothetical protein